MPWQKESVMSQRRRLVEQMLLPGANISALCVQWNISRPTAYKWLERYTRGGLGALADASKEPLSQPTKTADAIERVVISAHKEFPFWGPYKLKQYLRNENLLEIVPSHPTISRILKRNGCEVIKSTKSHPAQIRFERSQPNELWQMDFKGSFMMKVNRCHPLTVLDDCSRFSVGLKACNDEKKETVQSHLTSIFKEYGLPLQINVDNGSPWGDTGLEDITVLEVWLMKLGVRLSHSAPFHPQTNGKDERFHRTLKLEVLHQREYKNQKEMQRVFDEWRHVYNFKRPHEAVDNKPPSSRYCASTQKFPSQLIEYDYGQDEVVRKVSNDKGLFSFKGKSYLAGRGLCGEWIAIKETDKADEYSVCFMDRIIKNFKLEDSV